MKIVSLKDSMAPLFIEYCRRYCREQDITFMPEDGFRADQENPTYVLVEEGEVKGAVSLMLAPELVRQKKGRFRIFHSTLCSLEPYRLMLEAILPHAEGLEQVMLYIPEAGEMVAGFVKALGFKALNYSWYMERQNYTVPEAVLPAGCSIRPLRRGIDEQNWCDLTNKCFNSPPGGITVQMFSKELAQDDYIEGGVMMLYHADTPIGAIRISREHDDKGELAYISYVSVIEEYRGMGLGRVLLRKALEFALEKGLPRAGLAVSAENPRAAQLYIGEGFERVYSSICYTRLME